MENYSTNDIIAVETPSTSSNNYNLKKKYRSNNKTTTYIIFDPSIWQEQSYNHFMSFIRAIINTPSAIAERYARFESSNFTISNIKRYKSGKKSLARTDVTGFDSKGIYQTAIISCTLPHYKVLIPQKLYKILEDNNYDLTFACVKRDPSLSPTCMYVCLIEKNSDPSIEVIVISQAIAKGLNQDQDGDKDACYIPHCFNNDYDARQSYKFKVARMELANAFKQQRTILNKPRYSYSETNLILQYRNPDAFAADEFFKRINGRNATFANEAGASYLEDEKEAHDELLLKINEKNGHKIFTCGSLSSRRGMLVDIIKSGAKADFGQLNMLLEDIGKNQTLFDRIPSMINLCNKYISSGQELRCHGRSMFTIQYAAHDLTVLLGKIFINKICIADYVYFASIASWLFNDASCTLFLEDLIESYELHNNNNNNDDHEQIVNDTVVRNIDDNGDDDGQ